VSRLDQGKWFWGFSANAQHTRTDARARTQCAHMCCDEQRSHTRTAPATCNPNTNNQCKRAATRPPQQQQHAEGGPRGGGGGGGVAARRFRRGQRVAHGFGHGAV
jgi:hypothetical protein